MDKRAKQLNSRVLSTLAVRAAAEAEQRSQDEINRLKAAAANAAAGAKKDADDADDNDPATGNSTQGGDQWLETFDFDLVAPVANSIGITAPKSAPWNQTFPHFAKNEDEIRLSFTTDEAIESMSENDLTTV